MLLTVVALKLVTADDLPKISYMTLLDYYFVFCAGFMGLIIVACVIAGDWYVATRNMERLFLFSRVMPQTIFRPWSSCQLLNELPMPSRVSKLPAFAPALLQLCSQCAGGFPQPFHHHCQAEAQLFNFA